MNDPIDELKLTAYALGELDDPVDRSAVEAHLASDPAGRRHVEEAQATGRRVSDELAKEPVVGMTALHHAAIARRLAGETVRPIGAPPSRRNWALWGSLAASVVIVATVTGTVIVPLLSHIGNGSLNAGRARPSQSPDDATALPPMVLLPDPLHSVTIGEPQEWPSLPSAPMPQPHDISDIVADGAFVPVSARPVSTVPMPTRPENPDRPQSAGLLRALARGDAQAAEWARTDELINAMVYHDPPPHEGDAVGIQVESAACPWNPGHQIVRIGLRATDGPSTRPASYSARPTPVALDVTLRVEFNPARASAYRLLGYESHAVGGSWTSAGFAGFEASGVGIFAPGQRLTALYEIVPAGMAVPSAASETKPPLRYQILTPAPKADGAELLTATVRWREPERERRRSVDAVTTTSRASIEQPSEDLRVAAAAAVLGLSLRQSPEMGQASPEMAIRLLDSLQSTDMARGQLRQAADKARVSHPATKPQ